MNENEFSPVRKPAGLVRTALRKSAILTASAAMLAVLGAFAQPAERQSVTLEGKLKAGDIIYADSGNAIEGGFIVKVVPNTGEQTVLSSGGDLLRPFDLVFDAQGQIIASDSGHCCRLMRIAPDTGQQTIVANNSPLMLGAARSLAVGRNGDVMVANGHAIICVNPVSGETRIVSSGDDSFQPLGVTLAASGQLFVLNRPSPGRSFAEATGSVAPRTGGSDVAGPLRPGAGRGFPNEILRVHPENGTRKVVSQGGYLHNPQAIVAKDNFIYVTDVASEDGNFGVGRVIRVDSRTGAQTIVSEGGYLIEPVGIAVEDSGQIVVGDPYTINLASNDLFDGGVVRIDPVSGAQTLIARGYGSMVNPRGLTIVPAQPSGRNGVAINAR